MDPKACFSELGQYIKEYDPEAFHRARSLIEWFKMGGFQPPEWGFYEYNMIISTHNRATLFTQQQQPWPENNELD